MTVSSLTNRVEYAGAGSTGPYTFPFRILAAADLLVTKRVDEADETLVLGTDYTLTGTLNAAGSITLTDALETGETLVLRRVPALLQPADFENAGSFFGKDHQTALDRLAMQLQAVKDQVDRSAGVSETYDPADLSLRVKPETGKILGWLDDVTLGNFEVTTTAIGYALLAGEVGVTDLSYPWGHARRYGIQGDGTNEKAKFDFLFASVVACDTIREIELPPGDYNVGNISGGSEIFTLVGISDLRIHGPSARMICNTTDSTVTKIFLFVNCPNIDIDLRGYDTGFDDAITWKGAHLVMLYASSLTGLPIEGARIRAHAEHMLSPLVVDGNAGADRITDIRIDIVCVDTYYGAGFQNNGDHVRGDVHCTRTRRAYFPYGVTDHDVTVRVDSVSAATSDGGIVIARYGGARDTTDMRIRATFSGDCTFTALVKFIHIGSLGAGAEWIDNIDLTINIERTGTISGSQAIVRFIEQSTLGVIQATTNAHWDRIRLSGNAFTNAASSVAIDTKQSREGLIILDPSCDITPDNYQPYWPGFALRLTPTRELRTLSGSLTGGAKIVIPMAAFDGRPFTIKLITRMRDGGLAAANSTYREDLIDGWNASGGGLGITATNMHTITRNTACVPTFTAVGETIEVTFAGAPFNTASCFAQVEVEFGTPRRYIP